MIVVQMMQPHPLSLGAASKLHLPIPFTIFVVPILGMKVSQKNLALSSGWPMIDIRFSTQKPLYYSAALYDFKP